MTCSPSLGRSSNLATTNRYIVSLKERVEDEKSLAFLEEDGFRHVETFDFPEESFPNMGGDMILIETAEDMTQQQVLTELSSDPRIEFAEPDLEVELRPAGQDSEQRKPNDLKSSLWGLHKPWGKRADIDAPEAWTKTVGSRTGPIIAVLDTGIDLNHPDLKANLWVNTREIPNNGKDDDRNGVVDDVHGYNAYRKTGDPTDLDGHGTHCAGTIGAVGDNDEGIVGVNWQARIMPIKIFNDKEKPTAPRSAILRGISYATRNGARITSNSWGGGRKSRSVSKAFKNSQAFHLMAAGNDSQDNDAKPHYPSSYRVTNSLSVASMDRWADLSSFSNYGATSVDLAAPGSSIYSTVPGGYGYKSGTSMATPHVSGVAGLVMTSHPHLSNAQLKAALMQSTEKTEALDGKVVSGGFVNANKALEVAENLNSRGSSTTEA